MFATTIVLVFCIILLADVASACRVTTAGSLRAIALQRTSQARPLAMSSNEDNDAPTNDNSEPELKFSMNKRVRLGRSRDQDGKSNIWSIEPTMEVTDEPVEDQGKKNLLIGGGVIAIAIACLPLFSLFSKLFSDPSDF